MSKIILKTKQVVQYIIWVSFDFYIRIIEYFQAYFEKRKGLDFAKQLNEKRLGYTGGPYQSYQTGGMIKLKKILSKLSISEKDLVLDVGSGKGKSLHTLHQYPFKKVDGVELSKELCDIAKKNLETLNIKDIDIYNCDATTFTDIDKYNYFFFSNPFVGEPMQVVANNIKLSHKKLPRKITVIYYVPLCHKMFMDLEIFNVVISVNSFKVYQSK